MIRQFEKFTGGPFISSRDRVHVTINKKGALLFNRRMYELMGEPKAVVLFFDTAASVIGVSAAHPQLTEAFPLRTNGTAFKINAISFAKHYGIQIDATEVFLTPEIDEKGILHLDLRRTRTVFGRKRRKKKDQ